MRPFFSGIWNDPAQFRALVRSAISLAGALAGLGVIGGPWGIAVAALAQALALGVAAGQANVKPPAPTTDPKP